MFVNPIEKRRMEIQRNKRVEFYSSKEEKEKRANARKQIKSDEKELARLKVLSATLNKTVEAIKADNPSISQIVHAKTQKAQKELIEKRAMAQLLLDTAEEALRSHQARVNNVIRSLSTNKKRAEHPIRKEIEKAQKLAEDNQQESLELANLLSELED